MSYRAGLEFHRTIRNPVRFIPGIIPVRVIFRLRKEIHPVALLELLLHGSSGAPAWAKARVRYQCWSLQPVPCTCAGPWHSNACYGSFRLPQLLRRRARCAPPLRPASATDPCSSRSDYAATVASSSPPVVSRHVVFSRQISHRQHRCSATRSAPAVASSVNITLVHPLHFRPDVFAPVNMRSRRELLSDSSPRPIKKLGALRVEPAGI